MWGGLETGDSVAVCSGMGSRGLWVQETRGWRLGVLDSSEESQV